MKTVSEIVNGYTIGEHIDYETCMYSPEFETICFGLCGKCKFAYLFGSYVDKKIKQLEIKL